MLPLELQVSTGLYSVKIYWAMEGAMTDKQNADMVQDIKKITPAMRNLLAQEMNMRRTPELLHYVDPFIVLKRRAENAMKALSESKSPPVILSSRP